MTRSTIKNPIKPFKEPEREMHKKRRAAQLQYRNESLSIAGRNLLDEGPSFFPNQKPKSIPPAKNLREHSSPNASGFLNPIILPEEPTNKVFDAQDIFSLNEDEGWDRIEELIQYQDDSWDESFVSEPTSNDRLNRAHRQLSFFTSSTTGKTLKNLYLICDICGGAHEDDECDQVESREQACLSGGDIYDDPSLLKFYQNNDIPPWGNLIRKMEEEEGPD
ncbi:hypothetical protein Tco_0528612 [Tanacetum coccineum]